MISILPQTGCDCQKIDVDRYAEQVIELTAFITRYRYWPGSAGILACITTYLLKMLYITLN